MGKCNYKKCVMNVSIIGLCNNCKNEFCLKHRYPDKHNCINYQDSLQSEKVKFGQKIQLNALTENKIDKL